MSEIILIKPTKEYAEQVMAYKEEMLQHGDSFDGCAGLEDVQSFEEWIPLGLEGMKEHLTAVKQTYPDYSMRVIRQYEDGDCVISEFIMEGTHEGEWTGIKPTHKRLSFTGVDIDKVIDGKIVEHGGAVNTFETLYEQHMIKPV